MHDGRQNAGHHGGCLHGFDGFFRGFPNDLPVHDLFDTSLASLQLLLVEDNLEDIGAVRQRGQNERSMIDVWHIRENSVVKPVDELSLRFWIDLWIDLPGKNEQDFILIGLKNASLTQLARDSMPQALGP